MEIKDFEIAPQVHTKHPLILILGCEKGADCSYVMTINDFLLAKGIDVATKEDFLEELKGEIGNMLSEYDSTQVLPNKKNFGTRPKDYALGK